VADCSHTRNITKHITISFRRMSPIPGGLEFSPGTTYYFLSIRGKDSSSLLNLTECKKNLKMSVLVSNIDIDRVSVNMKRRRIQVRREEEEEEGKEEEVEIGEREGVKSTKETEYVNEFGKVKNKTKITQFSSNENFQSIYSRSVLSKCDIYCFVFNYSIALLFSYLL